MCIEFHKLVASDMSRIMDYYESAAGTQLADEFYEELLSFFGKAADSPEGYAIRERDLRRVNLNDFHIIFFFALPATPFAFSLFAITADDLRWELTEHSVWTTGALTDTQSPELTPAATDMPRLRRSDYSDEQRRIILSPFKPVVGYQLH
jgi:plasmid stabilization system protein ParE